MPTSKRWKEIGKIKKKERILMSHWKYLKKLVQTKFYLLTNKKFFKIYSKPVSPTCRNRKKKMSKRRWPKALYGCSGSGWMTQELVNQYLIFFKKSLKPGRSGFAYNGQQDTTHCILMHIHFAELTKLLFWPYTSHCS